ncbi:MAG: NUDIX domain-containing protein [Nocardioides sp.]
MDKAPPLTDVEESWPVASSTDLHRDDWVVALRADRIRRPGTEGPDFRRLVLEHPGAVVVLAIDDQERVCCLAQYRHPAGRRFVELPAGLCDEPGEEPLSVARRELVEEAGLSAGTWSHLTSAYSSPGLSAELIHYFLARDLTHVDRGDFDLQHEEADMTLFWAPFGDLYDAALAGRLTDAPLVLALLLAQARGQVQATPRGE